jgi:aspartate/methionine/tyrosine aminotransferase
MSNRRTLEDAFEGSKRTRVWPAQGGWYALVEVLDGSNDEELVLDLIQKHQVNVQPGGFYDFAESCFLVVSLLPQLEVFQTGANRLKKRLY